MSWELFGQIIGLMAWAAIMITYVDDSFTKNRRDRDA